MVVVFAPAGGVGEDEVGVVDELETAGARGAVGVVLWETVGVGFESGAGKGGGRVSFRGMSADRLGHGKGTCRLYASLICLVEAVSDTSRMASVVVPWVVRFLDRSPEKVAVDAYNSLVGSISTPPC